MTTKPALRVFTARDLPWLVEQHRVRYTADEGFDDSFAGVVSRAAHDFLIRHDSSRDAAWIAWCSGQRAGSIFCSCAQDARAARLRLFFVEPEHRRQGIGELLLANCLDFARQSGCSRVIVSTYSAHEAACALYRKAGFQLTDSKPARAFGRELTELGWELALS